MDIGQWKVFHRVSVWCVFGVGVRGLFLGHQICQLNSSTPIAQFELQVGFSTRYPHSKV